MGRKGFAHILLLIPLAAIFSLVIFYLFKSGALRPVDDTQVEENKQTVDELFRGKTSLKGVLDLKKYSNTINDGEIYYIKAKRLYVLDTSTMGSTEVNLEGAEEFLSDLYISEDGKYMFIITGKLSGVSGGLIIYNLLTKREIKVKGDENWASPRVTHFSPNGKYFILTNSCCPGNVGRTIVSIDGVVIKDLIGTDVVFSPDGTKFLLGKEEYYIGAALGTDVYNSSIYLVAVDGNTITEKKLLAAENQISYAPKKWLNNTSFVYEKRSFKRPFPELDDAGEPFVFDERKAEELYDVWQNPETSYRASTIDGTGDVAYNYEEVIDEAGKLEIQSPSGRWKLKKIYDKEKKVWEHYIMNSDESIKIFLDVEEAFWKPTL